MYEKGINRVGWSRACDIADLLQTPISYFREDMDDETLKQSPMRLINPDNEIATPLPPMGADPLTRQETLELIKAYYLIRNRRLARNLFDLIKNMSTSNSTLP